MALQLNTRLRDPKLREAVEYVFPLPPVAGAVSAVRRRAGTVLTDWNVSPGIFEDALLVVSELLTNAIVHALPRPSCACPGSARTASTPCGSR